MTLGVKTQTSAPQEAVTTEEPGGKQAEKSAAMRARLLDATVDCLVEVGYARTTTTLVSERAGVSRGAMLHHFPTKALLVTQAVIHVADKRIAEFRASVKHLPAGSDFLASVLDLMWANFSSPTSYAMLELTVAARTDRELFESLQPVVRRYETLIFDTAKELFGPLAPSEKEFFQASRTLYFLMHGLVVTDILRDEPDEVQAFLKGLKKQVHAAARSYVEARMTSTSSGSHRTRN